MQAASATHECSEQSSHSKTGEGERYMVRIERHGGYGEQKLDKAKLLAQTTGGASCIGQNCILVCYVGPNGMLEFYLFTHIGQN
jgi:hypothetical protein